VLTTTYEKKLSGGGEVRGSIRIGVAKNALKKRLSGNDNAARGRPSERMGLEGSP